MRVLLFGGSGMVGQSVLRECLKDPEVEAVVAVGRRPMGSSSPKLSELLAPDLTNLAAIEDRLSGFDAGFFCLGTSSVGLSEADFTRVTYDLTLSVAEVLVRRNPTMTFVYVSGAGTDSTEHGPRMWARVKGRTENALQKLPFRRTFLFRPGAIQPTHGIRSRTRVYRIAYLVLWPVLPLLRRAFPGSVTTSERIGRAMIRVVRDGAPSAIVENRMINELGRPGARS